MPIKRTPADVARYYTDMARLESATRPPATPGPWRVGDAGYTVFGPPNPIAGQPPTMVAQRVKRADATLLAAAPELFVALTELLRITDAPRGAHPAITTAIDLIARVRVAR